MPFCNALPAVFGEAFPFSAVLPLATMTRDRQVKRLPWPGNVRELQHCIERAVVTTKGPELNCADVAAIGSKTAAGDLRSVGKGAKKLAEKAHIMRWTSDVP